VLNKLKETGIQAHDHQPFSGLLSSEYRRKAEINLISKILVQQHCCFGYQQAGVLQNLRKTTVVEDFK